MANDGYRSEDEDSTVGDGLDDFRPPDIADPVVTLERDPTLVRSTWVERDATDWHHYIPSFTRPGYEDGVEVSADGTRQRPRRGGWWDMMRPALLPTDPPATQYAQRFGMVPDRRYNERGEARSMLTPVPPSGDNDRQWGVEQSFQSTIFQSFTTKELSDLGALDPTQAMPRPDLQGNLHHFFTRDRWSRLHNMQETIRQRFWYNLNGERKSWAAEENDELWAALQPTLQLVSRVLESGHPFWKAMLSLYHLRPVPEEMDGRTDEEKASPDYKPYSSVWYEIDRSQMYPSARLLMDAGFDSEAAALEMLRILLRFSIVFFDGTAHAFTRPRFSDPSTPENCKIQIELNAVYIWPLLAPQFSVSEKTAVTFNLAKVILHELAHAARYVLRDRPWTPPPNTNFNQDIINTLQDLYVEAGFGTLREHVFQDVPQVEEGKCFEQQLWGRETVHLPEAAEKRATDTYRPVITARSWPWSHPKIHLQNQASVNAGLFSEFTRRGYKTWLLDPPASAYELWTPIPVSFYAKFMQQSWWDTDFVKFGHQGLKLPIHSTNSDTPLKTVAKTSESMLQFLPMLTMVIRSQIAIEFIEYAIRTMYELDYAAIVRYLVLLTREAASASLMRNRLHYEKITWPRRLQGIRDFCDKSTQNFDTVWNSVNQNLLGDPSTATLVNIQRVSGDIRHMLRDLTELRRLVGIEIQYAQGIAAEYILKTPEERVKIHRRYMRFLRNHLLTMTNMITAALGHIGRDHQRDGDLEWRTIFAPWEARLMFMVATNPRVVDPPLRHDIQVATDAMAQLRQETQQICEDLSVVLGQVDSVGRILGDNYINFPIAAAPAGIFPGVPIARKMMDLSKALEPAAVQEIIGLSGNQGVDDIVRQWMRLLGVHLGLSDRVRGVQDQVIVARGKEDLRAIKMILFQAKRDENQPAGAAEAGQAAKDQQLARLRDQIRHTVRNNGVLITHLRDICREEGADGDAEFQTIMSIPYPVPPRQPPQSQRPPPHQ